MSFTFGGLFSGTGMLEFACEQLGGQPVFMCESDPFCQRILRRRFPGVPLVEDVRDVTRVRIKEVYMGRRHPEALRQRREMYEAGFSLEEVADYFAVSRQAVWEMFKAADVELRSQYGLSPKELERRKERGTYVGSKDPRYTSSGVNPFDRGGSLADDRAQNIAEKAIERGFLIRPEHCSECGQPKIFKDGRSGIQAHHDDYNKPLEVRWLCQPCHFEWHRTNRPVPVGGDVPEPFVDVLVGGF